MAVKESDGFDPKRMNERMKEWKNDRLMLMRYPIPDDFPSPLYTFPPIVVKPKKLYEPLRTSSAESTNPSVVFPARVVRADHTLFQPKIFHARSLHRGVSIHARDVVVWEAVMSIPWRLPDWEIGWVNPLAERRAVRDRKGGPNESRHRLYSFPSGIGRIFSYARVADVVRAEPEFCALFRLLLCEAVRGCLQPKRRFVD